MKGLVIVNWNYNCQDLNNLVYPEKDGQLMERMLRDGGYETLVLTVVLTIICRSVTFLYYFFLGPNAMISS